MDKRSVSYKGFDCIADAANDTYMAYGSISQKQVAWTYQPHYARVTVYFGCAVVFVAILKNAWYQYYDRAYKRNPNRSAGYFGSFVAVLTSFSRSIGYKPINVYVSKYLGLPATSASFMFVVASTAYLACYCFIPHFWYRGCRGFGSPPLAVRSGIMATALIPFIYILSGKSNMVTLVTGISYEKLNTLHQFTGVACFVLSVVHTIPFLYQDLAEGGASNLLMKFQTESYYYNGIPPLVLLGVLCFGALSLVRKYFYEAFLHVHWICAMGFFGTLVWHINKSLGMWDYMWASLAFWMTQLIYRALVKTCFRPNALFLKPRPAQLRLLDANTFEVSVTNVADLHWGPGQHCFLRFVGSRILDNHPFSISTVPVDDGRENEMKFIIIPKKGLTGKLYSQLEHAVTSNQKVFIDGPYGGTSRDPLSFDNLTLISSGTGVTVTLPFLQYACQAISKAGKADASAAASVLRDIHFVWIIRHKNHFEWIRSEIECALQQAGDFVTIDIYIVNDEKSENEPVGEDKSLELEKLVDSNSSQVSPLLDRVNFIHSKPNIPHVMEDSRRFMKRRNMIVSSGSSSMRREVCNSVSRLQEMIFNADMNESGPFVEEIYLHTEAFGWG